MRSTLTKALSEGRFDDKLKLYTIPRLLIIDEIANLQIDRQAATLSFQLISRRYERGPMILTSNQSFGSWGDVFGAPHSTPAADATGCSAATPENSRRSSPASSTASGTGQLSPDPSARRR